MSGEIEATARGRLAADAVVKTVSGQQIAELRLAVDVRRKDGSGEWQKHHTDWLDVTVWGYNALGAATLTKGQLVEVRGSLTPSAYLSSNGDAVAASKLNAAHVGVIPRAPQPAV